MDTAAKKNPNRLGRPKGALNVKTKIGPKAIKIAERLGVDPFEILLHFANGDWKALGYPDRTRLVPTKDGSIEVDNIEPQHRVQAASAACPYLFPKLQTLQLTGDDGKSLGQSLGEFFLALDAQKKRDGSNS